MWLLDWGQPFQVPPAYGKRAVQCPLQVMRVGRGGGEGGVEWGGKMGLSLSCLVLYTPLAGRMLRARGRDGPNGTERGTVAGAEFFRRVFSLLQNCLFLLRARREEPELA
jgi:hypothetical protein